MAVMPPPILPAVRTRAFLQPLVAECAGVEEAASQQPDGRTENGPDDEDGRHGDDFGIPVEFSRQFRIGECPLLHSIHYEIYSTLSKFLLQSWPFAVAKRLPLILRMSRSIDWSRFILAPPKRPVQPAKAARQSTRDADDGRAASTPLGSYEPSASQQPRTISRSSRSGGT